MATVDYDMARRVAENTDKLHSVAGDVARIAELMSVGYVPSERSLEHVEEMTEKLTRDAALLAHAAREIRKHARKARIERERAMARAVREAVPDARP